jgi:hypothetical protein
MKKLIILALITFIIQGVSTQLLAECNFVFFGRDCYQAKIRLKKSTGTHTIYAQIDEENRLENTDEGLEANDPYNFNENRAFPLVLTLKENRLSEYFYSQGILDWELNKVSGNKVENLPPVQDTYKTGYLSHLYGGNEAYMRNSITHLVFDITNNTITVGYSLGIILVPLQTVRWLKIGVGLTANYVDLDLTVKGANCDNQNNCSVKAKLDSASILGTYFSGSYSFTLFENRHEDWAFQFMEYSFTGVNPSFPFNIWQENVPIETEENITFFYEFNNDEFTLFAFSWDF